MKPLSALHSAGVRLVLTLGLSTVVLAAPPQVPLPVPSYSFDRQSPQVLAGLVHPGAVLALDQPFPSADVPAANLGLFNLADDLDALSSSGTMLSDPLMPFLFLFSVDRETVGLADPEPLLVGLRVPYNVKDQAARGQAAGDEFVSTEPFTRLGPLRRGGGLNNSTECRNNFDEGGTDFAAQPPTHSRDNPGSVPQDNVDALAQPEQTTARGGTSPRIINLYFSVDAESPSLPLLPGEPSGANLYFNADPDNSAITELYAAAGELGLQLADDIDAMIVFDLNGDRHFHDGLAGGPDQVLFSLRRGSPSLATLPGSNLPAPAAHVYSVRPNQPPMLFAPAELFGLGAQVDGIYRDDIDALDLLIGPQDGVSAAALHGIRAILADWDDDGAVDVDDFMALGGCLAGPAPNDAGSSGVPDCEYLDLDHDQDVDLRDARAFQLAFGTPP